MSRFLVLFLSFGRWLRLSVFYHFVGTSLTNLQFFVNFVNRTVFSVCRLSKYVWVCVIKFLSVVLHVRLRIYGSQNFSSSESSLGSHSTN